MGIPAYSTISKDVSMNIYSIYKATNKSNGKIYIGFDSNWPKRRNEHKTDSKRRKTKFCNAIKKYGWDSFEWEVIYQSKDYNHTLEKMENKFIVEYDSYRNGYNSTLGGEGSKGIKLSKEHKNKISKSNKGKKVSEETKELLREIRKNQKNVDISGIGSYWRGRKRSKEDLEKKSQIFGKEWIVIKPNGERMNIKSLRKFCRENDLSASHMGSVALGKRTHHKGWKCEKSQDNE